MIFKEITIHTTTQAAELVADIFQDNNLGVAISDKKDILELEAAGRTWDYIDESLFLMSDVVLVKGFLPADIFETQFAEIKNRLEFLKQNSVFPLGSLEILVRNVNENDWFEVWKKHYKKIFIENVVICPIWESYEGNCTLVKIDPGMAFGTGEHETSMLCIEMLQKLEVCGKDTIDVGCGSGILGITAHKLGAKSVYMCDIDEVATSSAKINAKLNNCLEQVTIECRDLLKETDRSADIILINIVADVLIFFSKNIKKHLRKGGKIILSGIIHSRVDDVKKAYENNGLKVAKHLAKGEWNCILVEHE